MINGQEVCGPIPIIRPIHGGEKYKTVDPVITSSLMTELGISDDRIVRTTVLVDGRNRNIFNGVAFPRLLAKLRFFSMSRDIEGPVVRLSTRMRGRVRPNERIRRTLVHEMEHVAQSERGDPKLLLGNLAIYGGMVAGAYTGNRLAAERSNFTKITATVLGAMVGKQIGYMNAPHENQARERSKEIHTDAVTIIE